jgi:hypothetical protein
MHGNQGNFWLLVVGSQIDNLTSGPSFGHNLCFNYSNGSCEPTLDIYIPRAFQGYNEIFNPMSFDPYNHPLKIRESIETPTPKMGVHLGMRGFLHILLHSHEHEMWLSGSLLARTFASPCLGHEPKARVATLWLVINLSIFKFFVMLWKIFLSPSPKNGLLTSTFVKTLTFRMANHSYHVHIINTIIGAN